jgi:hypothetical protein
MTSSTDLSPMVRYWRKTLSDEDIAGIKPDLNRPCCPSDEIYRGTLPVPMQEILNKEWRARLVDKQQKGPASSASKQVGTGEDDLFVPVVLLIKAFGAHHEHGRAINGQSSDVVHFAMHVPAMMQPTGELVVHSSMTPWVPRRYMRPNHDNENLPLVADIAAFDQYLSANPLSAQGFSEVLLWCDDLWQSITDGQSPEGFVEIDRVYAVIADGMQGAGQNLCRLYDALETEKESPPLFAKICNGTSDPVTVSPALRISALSSPRGTMSTAYGLADSQSDAVAALVSIGNDANILAVNGPPGTGKTTLLQSVIATLVVSRAIAGGDPAVIVGSSTNNQAVTNILKSMNDILKDNPSAGEFPWSKRWVPDAETYGMYLPSAQSKTSAEFAFALKSGQEWSGFPERENDPDYIQNAKTLWLTSYQETYGTDPLDIESGLAMIQADIRNLVKAAGRCAPVWASWMEAAEWWRNIAGSETPDIYISRARSGAEQEIQEKTQDFDRAVAARSRADHDHQAAVTEAERGKSLEMGKVNQRKAAIDQLRHLKLAVNKATLPQGAIENFCYFSVAFRPMFHQRKAVRLDTIRNDPQFQVAFSRLAFPEDHGLWVGHIDTKISVLSQWLESDMAAYNQVVRDLQAQVDTKLRYLESANVAVYVAQKHLEDARKSGAERVSCLDARMNALSSAKRSLYSTYDALCQRAESEFGISVEPIKEGHDLEIVDFDAVLDRTIRHACFQKAMRYWEGRWILEAERLLTNVQMKKGGRPATEARFRRWCMLTPCLVSTAHSLPKHFQYTKPIKDAAGKTVKDEAGKPQFEHPFLWSYIDLLIVDEAGQVGPHIGAGIFSLAKQSVVVGDIYQIEPVATGSPGIDHANAAQEGLAHHWENGAPTTPHMVSEPASGGAQGSIMRLAQGATSYVSPGTEAEPGIFLREHRRCRTEIISYCNELIYGGRLQPLSSPRKVEPPVRPMAYANVRGEEVRVGGSRSNPLEAKAIAQWIARNKDAWIAHYGKSIEEIVAVVTPFKIQASELQKALRSEDRSLAKVTAGTVHSLQGAERQIVVFSPVYQHENAKGLFFDRKPNMMNVAVSRAKDSFVVIGDVRIFDGNGNTPSALLGKYLFADEANELRDVNVNIRLPNVVVRAAKRLSKLEDHRVFLQKALTEATPGEVIVISSPWMTSYAIETDHILENVATAVNNNGAKVLIFFDENRTREKFKANTDYDHLLMRLQNAGAHVFPEKKLHSKVFIRGRGEIVEGSFNWLSAVRDQNNQWANYESSLWLSGGDAREAIRLALNDFKCIYNRDIQIPLTDNGAVD